MILFDLFAYSAFLLGCVAAVFCTFFLKTLQRYRASLPRVLYLCAVLSLLGLDLVLRSIAFFLFSLWGKWFNALYHHLLHCFVVWGEGWVEEGHRECGRGGEAASWR
jgi:hypothetical protein